MDISNNKPKRLSYSLDQQQDIDEFLLSDHWKPVRMLLEDLAQFDRDQLLHFDLALGGEKLMIAKARYEGANKLLVELERYRAARVKSK